MHLVPLGEERVAKEVVDRVNRAIIDNEGRPDRRLEPEVILLKDLPLVILSAIGPCIEVASAVTIFMAKRSDARYLRLNIDAMTPSRTGATPGTFALVVILLSRLFTRCLLNHWLSWLCLRRWLLPQLIAPTGEVVGLGCLDCRFSY
jgi:hypothetical protein